MYTKGGNLVYAIDLNLLLAEGVHLVNGKDLNRWNTKGVDWVIVNDLNCFTLKEYIKDEQKNLWVCVDAVDC